MIRTGMNLMEKRIGLWVLLFTLIAALAGCSSDTSTGSGAVKAADGQDLVLETQSTPGAVSFPELADALGYLGDVKLKKISDAMGGPESIQLTATGETDYGAAFTGAVIKSVAHGVDIKPVIGSYGSDENTYIGYYVLEDSEIKTAKDLAGKKIAINTLGAHSEFAIKQYLRNSNLTEEEIQHVELIVVPGSSAEQILRAGQVDVAALSGIGRDRALEVGGIRTLFKDIDLFGNFTAGEYFFRTTYIEENPDTVRTFVEGVAKAIEWARNTPTEEVIAKYTEIVEAREGNETTDNLKYFKGTGIADEGGVMTDKEFQVWIDWLVESGELEAGQIKAQELYTNEYNPYQK